MANEFAKMLCGKGMKMPKMGMPKMAKGGKVDVIDDGGAVEADGGMDSKSISADALHSAAQDIINCVHSHDLEGLKEALKASHMAMMMDMDDEGDSKEME